ncbi:MAG: molybdate ABC transporter substrate-binding protein [Lachnospiraceae bacterium]
MRKQNNRRPMKAAAVFMAAMMALTACGGSKPAETEAATQTETTETTPAPETEAPETEAPAAVTAEEATILVAAAASLKYSYEEELIPMFEAANPGIKVEATFDSSGKLQTQIEEGLGADVFMSAANKQMTALQEQNMIDADSVVDLLENKIVLIVPEGMEAKVTGFEDITNADTIAVGDPESVPAGQYAKEALTSLGIWDEVEAKSTKGTNVTEVLNWVAEGSADAGIVYATDAATTDKVVVIAEAPEGSLEQKVIYPVGIVSESENKEAAQKFVEFLQTGEALAVFEKYGFSAN